MRNSENIIVTLNNIISRRAGIDIVNEGLINDEFFGPKINMTPRDLMLTLYDIELVLEVRIDDEFILSGGFSSLFNIYNYLISE